MRKSKLLVLLGAAAAIAVGPAMTANASDGAASNSGAAVTKSAASSVGTAAACGTTYAQPGDYPGGPSALKLVDVTGLTDGTIVSTQNGVKFAPSMEKRSVPGSWQTWGAPPATETATPHILYSMGGTQVKITLPKKGAKKAAGMEIEPDPFAQHSFTVDYQKKNGNSICDVTVSAHGQNGAVLAAAKVKKAKHMVVNSNDGVGFSIAQVRWK